MINHLNVWKQENQRSIGLRIHEPIPEGDEPFFPRETAPYMKKMFYKSLVGETLATYMHLTTNFQMNWSWANSFLFLHLEWEIWKTCYQLQSHIHIISWTPMIGKCYFIITDWKKNHDGYWSPSGKGKENF